MVLVRALYVALLVRAVYVTTCWYVPCQRMQWDGSTIMLRVYIAIYNVKLRCKEIKTFPLIKTQKSLRLVYRGKCDCSFAANPRHLVSSRSANGPATLRLCAALLICQHEAHYLRARHTSHLHRCFLCPSFPLSSRLQNCQLFRVGRLR